MIFIMIIANNSDNTFLFVRVSSLILILLATTQDVTANDIDPSAVNAQGNWLGYLEPNTNK